MAGTSVSPGSVAASVTDDRLGGWVLGDRIDAGVGTTTYLARGADGESFAGRQARLSVSDGDLGAGVDADRLAVVAGLIRGLRHASLAPVLDAGVVDGRLFVAHSALPGTVLGDRLSGTGAATPAAAGGLVGCLASGLAYAHDRGVAHGDVRPGTIVLARDGKPVLTGFGGAPSGPVEVDPNLAPHAAPERLAGEAGFAADQFALAATAVAMLTGRRPERPGTAALDGCGVPTRLTDVLARALSPNPADRFPSMTAFADALAVATRAAAEDVVAGIWDALERRDYPMATMLVQTVQRLRPDDPQTVMLAAHVAQLGGGVPAGAALPTPGLVLPLVPQPGVLGAPDEKLEFLASLAAPAALPRHDEKRAWVVLAIGGIIGLVGLALIAVVAFASA